MIAAKGSATWAVLLGAMVIVSAGSFRLHNLDVWLHAATGEWIVEHGEVPHTNVLSEIHAEYPSVHDKWLFQVLTHGLLDGLGPHAMIALRLALMALLFTTLARTARGLGAGAGTTLLTLGLACLATRARFFARPDLVSLVLLAVFAHVALVARSDGRGVLRLLLPLQILWANVHGYFVLGWGMAAVVALAWFATGRAQRDRARRWALVAAVLCVSCLANPSGWRGWWHPFDILIDLRAHGDFYRRSIEEFLPTFAADPRAPWDRYGFYALGGLAVVALGARVLASLARRRRADGDGHVEAPALDEVLAPVLALAVVFGAMTPSMRRNMAPFALIVAAPTAAAMSWALRRLPRARSVTDIAAAAFALLLVAGEVTDATSIHDGIQRRAGFGSSRIAYPDGGIAYLAEHLPGARVATSFRYGSTFTGRRWPEQVASVNGNTHGYPTDYLIEVMAAASGKDAMAFWRLARTHDLQAALLTMDGPLAARLVRDPGWALVFLGVGEAVFARVDATDPDWLAAHDLQPRLAEGVLVPLPAVEERPWWGVARPAGPAFRAAALCVAAGYGEAARGYARAAVEESPDDAATLALAGLLALQAGEQDEALRLLRRSRATGHWHPLEERVDAALAEIGEPG